MSYSLIPGDDGDDYVIPDDTQSDARLSPELVWTVADAMQKMPRCGTCKHTSSDIEGNLFCDRIQSERTRVEGEPYIVGDDALFVPPAFGCVLHEARA